MYILHFTAAVNTCSSRYIPEVVQDYLSPWAWLYCAPRWRVFPKIPVYTRYPLGFGTCAERPGLTICLFTGLGISLRQCCCIIMILVRLMLRRLVQRLLQSWFLFRMCSKYSSQTTKRRRIGFAEGGRFNALLHIFFVPLLWSLFRLLKSQPALPTYR